MSVSVEEIALNELSSATLLQSPLWARFKADFGWLANAFRVTVGPWASAPLLVMSRRVGPGITLAYVPHGPGPAPGSDPASDLRALGGALAGRLSAATVCVRFDPLLPAGSLSGSGTGRGALRKSPVDVQPASTVIVPLGPAPADILAAMHKKNRYNIRLAERHGIQISEGSIDDLGAWYQLYRVTADRDRITIHPPEYYGRLFELARESDDVAMRLYLARHEGDLLAGIIVSEVGHQATYLYGASGNEKRNLMPNYALQWHAMIAARESGMTAYDLFGVPNADDRSHPMHGLYRFKTGFGGDLVHRVGSWDVVRRPIAYGAYRRAEQLRSFYFHRLRKSGAR